MSTKSVQHQKDKKVKLSYKSLVQDGDMEGLYKLGQSCLKTDKGKAIQCFMTAAENDYFPAMKKLYEIYGNGHIVQKDPSKANMWKKKMIILSKERADGWCRSGQYGKALEALKQANFLEDKTIQAKIREIRSYII